MGGEVKGGLLTLGLRKLIDLEGVSPLFNVPTCVLIAEKGKWPEYPVPGSVVSGDLMVKNRPLAEAQPLLVTRPTAYQRMDGRLVAEGSLSPLTLRQAHREWGQHRLLCSGVNLLLGLPRIKQRNWPS